MHPIRASLLALALAAGLAAPAALAAPAHEVTCASPQVARQYQAALVQLHQNRSEDAIAAFRAVAERDPDCAMARWGLSRAHFAAGNRPDALRAITEAERLAPLADAREQLMIAAWAKHLRLQGQADTVRWRSEDEVRRDASVIIAQYPDDPEAWLLRAAVEQNPLRGAPFVLAALKLQPSHPLAASWRAPAVPLPEIAPKPTQPVPPLAEAPQLFEGLGKCAYPVSTTVPEAQAYFNQGLRCFHSYVTPPRTKNGAAVCFQHAAVLDPECAMAHWGLSFCTPTAIKPADAANRALELALKKGTDRERRMCAARVRDLEARELENDVSRLRGQKTDDAAAAEQQKAKVAEAEKVARQKREEFYDLLDAAICAYPDDVELWAWRGKVFGSYLAAVNNPVAMPYQIAAHRLQPHHPSPNHELVHLYEAIERPALGWPYTWGYRNSAPNMPHANHMQGHLAMRLGRWQEAVDCTRTARKRSLEGFPELDPTHHITTMLQALLRMGHFKEAEAEPKAYRDGLPWARLIQMKADGEELDRWAQRRMETKSPDGFYVGALAKLDHNDLPAVQPLLANVEEQWKKNPENLYRYNEVKGRLLVQSGQVDEGLKLLREAARKWVKDTGVHAWGGGSYLLEVWGEAALRAGRLDEAEEAFHEAMAHEHGSVIGALGMQLVWERRGNSAMAKHYAGRAAAIWKDADPGALDRQAARLRAAAETVAAQAGP